MSVKNIKLTLLSLLVFCSLFALTSKTSCTAHDHADTEKSDISNQSADHYPVLHLLMQQQVMDQSFRPQHITLLTEHRSSVSDLQTNDLLINGYTKHQEHQDRFYKLILFPFHGFW
ncbi:MAG TPA: hypothetical protein VGN20_26125 [Mucilaginibacter sp.]|jgi:hypothetical protein